MKTLSFAALFCIALVPASRADCLDEIKAMTQAHMAAGPYHVSMEQASGGTSRKIEADVILPSSFHMKMPEMETVMTKDGTWMNMKGQWMKLPAAAAGQMTAGISSAMKSGMDGANITNVQCLGPQVVEGETLTGYSFDTSGEAMGVKAKSHIMAYKNDKGLPAIMVIDGEAMGHKSKTTQHITYDPSIKINPPK